MLVDPEHSGIRPNYKCSRGAVKELPPSPSSTRKCADLSYSRSDSAHYRYCGSAGYGDWWVGYRNQSDIWASAACCRHDRKHKELEIRPSNECKLCNNVYLPGIWGRDRGNR